MQKKYIVLYEIYMAVFATLLTVLFTALTACAPSSDNSDHSKRKMPINKSIDNLDSETKSGLDNFIGNTLEERFNAPKGFERIQVKSGSFAAYLRRIPLKHHDAPVLYYDGNKKGRDVYSAVIDIDIGDKDLQQCADAVMRLRAEYLYSKGLFDKIHFNFTNGFRADFTKWAQGYRIIVNGNKTSWIKRTGASEDYQSFRRYMDMVFAYSGTLSLSREMKSVLLEDMRIGDVFIKGASPGHCVIVMDMAINRKTGEKLFIIAQSYMPAQDIHILKNLQDTSISPWYSLNFGDTLNTPEWSFDVHQLMRFTE